MPDDVGQRLGRDAVGRDLDGGGQHRDLAGDVEADEQRAAVGPPHQVLDALAQRADQAEVVERGRAQVLDEPPDVRDGRADLPAERAEQFTGALGVGGEQVGGGVGDERDAGERGAEAVVEVAAQPAAFLLPGGDDPLPRRLQLVREQGGVDGDGQRRSDERQHGVVGGTEAALPRARADAQLADRRAVVLQRHDRHFVRHFAVLGEDVPGRRDRGVRDAQRGPDRRHDAGQAGSGELLADPGDDASRVAAVAVERAADRALQPRENGRDQQGHHDRGDRGPAELRGDEPVQQGDQHAVRQHDAGRQQHPREHARHDQADVEQAVPHDRDGHRDRDERDGEQHHHRRPRHERPRHDEPGRGDGRQQQPQQLLPQDVVTAPVPHHQRRDRQHQGGDRPRLRDRPQWTQ